MMSKKATNISAAQKVQKANFDKRKSFKAYLVDDSVLLKNKYRDDRKGGKFVERRTGPYTVVDVCGKSTYKLCDKNSKTLKRLVSGANLVPYIASRFKSFPSKAKYLRSNRKHQIIEKR